MAQDVRAESRAEPQFSQPVRQVATMLVVLGLTAACAIMLYPQLKGVFASSPYLKLFIVLVFFIGVAACFRQVLALIASVSWIEGFALERPGHDMAAPPQLLAPLAVLLRERAARRALSSTSTRSILESVSIRIEEQRDLTRYLIGLLIFLGLLGTFYGLATVIPAVVDTIRSMAPQEGASAAQGFDSLMTGLEGQLGGMGTAFGSSLLGLAGSLVVGLLELFASHAQNRFYRELEEWLATITRVGVAGIEADEPLTAAGLLAVMEQNAAQIETLREVVEAGAARAAGTEARIDEFARLVASPERRAEDRALMERIVSAQEAVAVGLAARDEDRALVARMVAAQEATAQLLAARDDETGRLDAETRARLRSIDTQVLRILEDMAGGRQDLVTEIRQDIAGLAEALRALAARRG